MSESAAESTESSDSAGADPAPNSTTSNSTTSAAEPTLRESVLEQIGGITGLVESSVPVAVFVIANVIAGLRPGIYASVASAVLIAVVRLIRHEPVRHAINGLVGVVIAAFIAGKTGRAENFYLPGILAGLGYGLLCAGSVAVRWPLVGVIVSFLDGTENQQWRAQRRLRGTYDRLSLLWMGVFFLRAAVQGLLYLADRPNWLGLAKIMLGLPLFGVALLVTLWRIRVVRGSVPRVARTDSVPASQRRPDRSPSPAPTPPRAPGARHRR